MRLFWDSQVNDRATLLCTLRLSKVHNHTAISEPGLKTRTNVWISSPLQNEQDWWNAAKVIFLLTSQESQTFLWSQQAPPLSIPAAPSEKWKHPHSIPTGVLQLPIISLESSDIHQHQSAERDSKRGHVQLVQEGEEGTRMCLWKATSCWRDSLTLPSDPPLIKHSLHCCPLLALPALWEEVSGKTNQMCH